MIVAVGLVPPGERAEVTTGEQSRSEPQFAVPLADGQSSIRRHVCVRHLVAPDPLTLGSRSPVCFPPIRREAALLAIVGWVSVVRHGVGDTKSWFTCALLHVALASQVVALLR